MAGRFRGRFMVGGPRRARRVSRIRAGVPFRVPARDAGRVHPGPGIHPTHPGTDGLPGPRVTRIGEHSGARDPRPAPLLLPPFSPYKITNPKLLTGIHRPTKRGPP
ncbi:hypothetical protein GCM10010313_43160 [Streptomyces violarus]|nr:hypothetical protein GCM10010313_43160 [Streptomyces violarus]